MPTLLYGLESCQLSNNDLHSLDFTYNRMCMKLFKSSNIELIKECQGYFRCLLPSLNVKERCQKFTSKYENSVNTIRYDSVYLTCSKKLTGSQLSLPHGTNKKIECETKNKMMSVIGPVQSRYREAVQ